MDARRAEAACASQRLDGLERTDRHMVRTSEQYWLLLIVIERLASVQQGTRSLHVTPTHPPAISSGCQPGACARSVPPTARPSPVNPVACASTCIQVKVEAANLAGACALERRVRGLEDAVAATERSAAAGGVVARETQKALAALEWRVDKVDGWESAHSVAASWCSCCGVA